MTINQETLAQKQVRLAREAQARGGNLPPWKQVGYDRNNIEMNAAISEAIVRMLDQAKIPEGAPMKELEAIRVQAHAAVFGFDELRNAPRNSKRDKQQANRLRAAANDHYLTACRLIDDLDNSMGFDLWSIETSEK